MQNLFLYMDNYYGRDIFFFFVITLDDDDDGDDDEELKPCERVVGKNYNEK